MIEGYRVSLYFQKLCSTFAAHVLTIACCLITFCSLIQLEDGIHRHHEHLVDLAGDVVVDMLEVFCSSSDARDIPVQGNKLGSLYSLQEKYPSSVLDTSDLPAEGTYRQSLLVICLLCPALCLA